MFTHRTGRCAYVTKSTVRETRAGFEAILLSCDVTTDATYPTLHAISAPAISFRERSRETLERRSTVTHGTGFTDLSYAV